MADTGTAEGAWHDDPFGRFTHRWWDGSAWTDQVNGPDGQKMTDPEGVAPSMAAPALAPDFDVPATASKAHGALQYKVLTQKDRLLGNKFNPTKLEDALNVLAQEGWRVVGVTTAEFPGLVNKREEMVVLLERTAP